MTAPRDNSLPAPSPGPDAGETGIEFRNVGKRYASGADAPWAVDDISFTIAAGTLTTLLGPSGCGKTTTLRMIAGLETPTCGRIFIGGRDVTALGPADRNVSMVFQSYALFPHMDVATNVAYGLTVTGVAKPLARQRAQAAMALVGLSGLDQRLPSELSGGQQQRVALARALVLEPAVLLFDEPLSNLDARLRRSMREEIRALQQRLKLTVAYVTHDQGEALAVSDEIIVMQGGVIAQSGSPRQLYDNPGSAFVAGFMGEAMLFDGHWHDAHAVQLGPLRVTPRVPAPTGSAPTPCRGQPVRVAVRPEAWRIGPAGSGDLPATVLKAAYLGSTREYSFDTELGTLFVVDSSLAADLAIADCASLTLVGHCVVVGS